LRLRQLYDLNNYETPQLLDPKITNAQLVTYYTKWKDDLVACKEAEGTCRVRFSKSGNKATQTVSEGQGYGMIITVAMSDFDTTAQNTFNAMLKFAESTPSTIKPHLMSWKYFDNKPNKRSDSAFDEDADIVYSLILANEKWGSQSGGINYLEKAKTILGDLTTLIGNDSFLPLVGDWVEQNGNEYNQYTTRSSDFMLANFMKFKSVLEGASATKWDTAITTLIGLINKNNENNSRGLLPDFLKFKNGVITPAANGFLEGNDGDYFYNACRDPWRFASYYFQTGDKRIIKELNDLTKFFYDNSNGNPNKIKSGYKLNGNALSGSNYVSMAFVAPFGATAMVKNVNMDETNQQKFLDDIVALMVVTHDDYFEDSINLLSLISMVHRK